jgi:hypothetical protein
MPVSLTPQRKRSRFFFQDALTQHTAAGDGKLPRYGGSHGQTYSRRDKKQKRPAVGCQMQVRSGRVCVGADFGTDLVVATRSRRTLTGLV